MTKVEGEIKEDCVNWEYLHFRELWSLLRGHNCCLDLRTASLSYAQNNWK